MTLHPEKYLDTLPRFATRGSAALKPGLDRIAALVEAMGRPDQRYPSVHVAGTHGKGSTASMVAAMLTAAGNRVGLHTSPHICHVRERMRVDGVPAPEEWLADAIAHYRSTFDGTGAGYFEVTLALSLLYFAEQRVDWAVVEAGLGGRLDATNILSPRLSIITRIGLDHTDILGETLEEIAAEKAGIIKPEGVLVFARQEEEARAEIEAKAESCGVLRYAVEDDVSIQDTKSDIVGNIFTATTPIQRYKGLTCNLGGSQQLENAGTALRAAEVLALPEDAIRSGLRDVRRLSGLRGRLEILQERPYIIADAAHNSQSIGLAMKYVRSLPSAGRPKVLFGFMRDRDPVQVAHLFSRDNAGVWVTALPSERAWPANELAEVLSAERVEILGTGPVGEGYEALKAQLAPEDVLLVTGSFQLLGALPELFCAERLSK